MKFHKTSLLLAVILALVGMAALATDYTWTGAKSNALDDGENWSGEVVPGSADKGTVTVSGSEPVTFTLSTDAFAPKTLVFQSAAGSTAPVVLDCGNHQMVNSDILDVRVRSFKITNGTWDGDTKGGERGKVSWGVGNETDTYEFTVENAQLNPPWGNWAWVNKAYAGGTLKIVNGSSTYLPLWQRNLTLICDNSTVSGMTPNSPKYGTNFYWHVTNKSTVETASSCGKQAFAKVIVDGDSTYGHNGHFELGLADSEAHDNLVAITNATMYVKSITIAGTNDVACFHNAKLDPRAAGCWLNLNGVSNSVTFSGTLPVNLKRYVSFGTASKYVVDAGLAVTNGYMSMSAASSGLLDIGENAVVYSPYIETRTSNADAARDLRFQVAKGATFHLEVMTNGDGVNGQSNVWQIVGTVKTDKGLDIGTFGTSDGCRVELLGDEAKLLCGMNVGGSTGHLTIGNDSNPNSVAICFKPGPNGFGGEAPLTSKNYSFGQVTVTDTCLEVDLSDYYAAVPARKEAYRVPLMECGIYKNLTGLDLEALNARAKISVPGGKLIVDGRVLYCEFEKKPGLLILVK